MSFRRNPQQNVRDVVIEDLQAKIRQLWERFERIESRGVEHRRKRRSHHPTTLNDKEDNSPTVPDPGPLGSSESNWDSEPKWDGEPNWDDNPIQLPHQSQNDLEQESHRSLMEEDGIYEKDLKPEDIVPDATGTLTSPSNQLLDEKVQADLDRFVDEESLEDNVEPYLSHDDTDPRDVIGRCQEVIEVCLGEVSVQASENCSLMIKEEMKENEAAHSEITLKLILDKKNNNVLCAEVGGDFINQLLSFLTFPLGAVFKPIPDNVSVLGGCIDNLYSSVENMGLECFKSEYCRNILLTTKLATFYGIEKQIMNLEEISSDKIVVSRGCPKCYKDNGYKPSLAGPCKHGVTQSEIIEHDPKLGKRMTCSGGAFVVNSRRFMVADNLHVSPLSFTYAIKTYETDFPIVNLVEKDVCLDKAKALSILRTMLISKSVLTDVFCPPKSKKEVPWFMDNLNSKSTLVEHCILSYLTDGIPRRFMSSASRGNVCVTTLYEVEEVVWIGLRKESFPHGSISKLKQRTDGPFRIIRKLSENAYQIDFPGESNISATFNIADLTSHYEDEAPPTPGE